MNPYNFLNNDYPSIIIIGGNKYISNEHYIIKKKQEYFDPNNKILAQSILQENNPNNIKLYEKNINNFDKDKWDKIYDNILSDINFIKFSQNKVLYQKLIEIDNESLLKLTDIGYILIKIRDII